MDEAEAADEVREAAIPATLRSRWRGLKKSRKILILFLLFYISSFAVSDYFGTYDVWMDEDETIYWVWEGAYQWPTLEELRAGREYSRTFLGVIYRPLDIINRYILRRHVTLVAYKFVGYSVRFFDYPGIGVGWNKRPNHPEVVSIPGKSSRVARKNYLEYFGSF